MRSNRIALVVVAVACALLLPSAWLAVRSWGQNPATPGDSTKYGPGDVTSLISSADAPTTTDAPADSTKRGTDVEPSRTPAADEPIVQGPVKSDVLLPVALMKECLTQFIGGDAKPIEGVIVDIFREAPKQDSPTPRVEVYGQTRSDGDGRIKLGLPVYVARSASGDEKRPVRFILYFTSPGLPVKSLVLDDVQLMPETIALPAKSTEEVYVPRNHLVEATDQGIVMAVRVTGTPGFTDRRDSEAGVSDTAPTYEPAPLAKPAVKGEMVVYHLQNASSASVAKVLTDLYAGQANIAVDARTNTLIVRAPADLQNTIEALIKELDRGEEGAESTPSGGGGSGSGLLASSGGFGGARGGRGGSRTGDSGGPQVVVSYPLHGGKAQEWAKLLANSMSGLAEIRADERTNSLVVTASPETHAEARLAIQLLEQLTPRNTPDSAGPPRPYHNVGAMSGPGNSFGNAGAMGGSYFGNMGAAQQAASKSMDAAVENLRNAKTKDEKQAAKDALRQTLVEVFTTDMQAREKAVKEIESRIGELRKQYQAREKVKDEIIDLQLKVLENEAAGLGFPAASGSDGQNRTMPRGTGGYSPPALGGGIRYQPGTESRPPRSGDGRTKSFEEVVGEQLLNVWRHSGIETPETAQQLADDLIQKGHLAISADKSIYAYVYDNPATPSDPAQIRVCSVVTGEVIASAEAERPVGKLVLSADGVYTKGGGENSVRMRMRIQLRPISSPRTGAGIDPTGAVDWDAAMTAQTRVASLIKEGHFVLSPDKKLYAYVETIAATDTPGGGTPAAAEIRVCDVATGKLVASDRTDLPVGELRFTDAGVEARDRDGWWQMRVPLALSVGPDGRVYEPKTVPQPQLSGGVDEGGGQTTPTTALPSSAPGGAASAASSANVLGDYKLLHSEYVTAREELRQIEAMVRDLVADAQKQNPQATEDDMKKQHPRQWQLAAVARKRWQQTRRMYQAKMELLEFDLVAAENDVAAAQSRYDRLKALYETNEVSATEVERQIASLETAKLDLQRAKTIYDLFRSIADEAEASDAAGAPEDDSGSDAGTGAEDGGAFRATPPDGAISALTPESIREQRAKMHELLEGKWVCVEAAADGMAIDTGEVARWELEFDFHDDSATVSYVGEDLKRVETQGNVTLDPQTSPPRFHVEVKLTDWKDPSRLSGPAIVDRGRLQMVNHGTDITLGRQLERPPSVFEFRRLAVETAAGIDEEPSADAPDETTVP